MNSFAIRVVTSPDLTHTTVWVTATGRIEPRTWIELDECVGVATGLACSELVIDLTALERLPRDGAELLAALAAKGPHQSPARVEIVCRPQSMTDRVLESVGITVRHMAAATPHSDHARLTGALPATASARASRSPSLREGHASSVVPPAEDAPLPQSSRHPSTARPRPGARPRTRSAPGRRTGVPRS
ncbi:hypothetical protein [Pseudonocardia sp.]|uniref:hypothetical protein n=1 Tax=Pseudonocardia sp. TaxID=60912 RepID=UPI003D0D9EF7